MSTPGRPQRELLPLGAKARGAQDAPVNPSQPALLLASPMSAAMTRELSARSEEHTSESSHTVISYAVFCLKKKKKEQSTCLPASKETGKKQQRRPSRVAARRHAQLSNTT